MKCRYENGCNDDRKCQALGRCKFTTEQEDLVAKITKLRNTSREIYQLRQDHEKILEETAWKIFKARQRAYDAVYGEDAHRTTHHGSYRYLSTTSEIKIHVSNGDIHADLIERGCRGNSDESVGGINIDDWHLKPEGIEDEYTEFYVELKKEQAKEAVEEKKSKQRELKELRKELQKLEQEVNQGESHE